MKTVFIGAGSMAESLLAGALRNGALSKENIYMTNRTNKTRLVELQQKYDINISYDDETLLNGAEIVILAMKPKDVAPALKVLKAFISENTLIISVLAGISIHYIEDTLEFKGGIVRAMPNTSATIGKSATGIAFNDGVTHKKLNLVLSLFNSIGMTAIIEEEKLDIVTALSGSGPAYFYYIVEVLLKTAEEMGLDQSLAKPLLVQTLLGAGEMLATSGQEAKTLRENVTSPGGTTEAGLLALEKNHVNRALYECLHEAAKQSKCLRELYQSQANAK
ncbi:pyrroline-5-carboxylate reductase [Bacillus pakistanensis]|uniref:Pyrroline-5-carboxylate reductase n=1 Tax=Rossellomorea pakistanensis TaxID=992288 RepID=A0ABS2N9M1_9BACI|nr:pyrroline-5-carboxylate reductase [Bacillus pakistanensis]MBM7584530.1 pyrroline-5-carboxylate reductase [Bacillus pakistanensis]